MLCWNVHDIKLHSLSLLLRETGYMCERLSGVCFFFVQSCKQEKQTRRNIFFVFLIVDCLRCYTIDLKKHCVAIHPKYFHFQLIDCNSTIMLFHRKKKLSGCLLWTSLVTDAPNTLQIFELLCIACVHVVQAKIASSCIIIIRSTELQQSGWDHLNDVVMFYRFAFHSTHRLSLDGTEFQNKIRDGNIDQFSKKYF